MKNNRLVKISKYLSKHLRHSPDRIGIELQPGGWVSVAELLVACKKENTIDDSQPLSERLPGNWNLVGVQYSGTAPSPLDPSQVLPFSGEGKKVSGGFFFDADTNLGNFDVNFEAEVDIGLGQPLTYMVNESRGGTYEIIDGDKIVRMINLAGDSIYDWNVRTNLPNRQVWFVTMYHDFGFPGLDSVAIDVETTMER